MFTLKNLARKELERVMISGVSANGYVEKIEWSAMAEQVSPNYSLIN